MQIHVHLLCWLTGSRARSVKARFAMEGTENLLTARAHPCPMQQSADGAVRPYPSAHLRRQAHMAYPMQQPSRRALQDSSFGVLGGMLGSRSRFGYFRLQKTGRGPSRQKMSVSE